MKLSGGHNKKICSIKWNSDFKYLALGGNYNLVCLWDISGKFNQNKSSFWDFKNSQSDEENENENEIENVDDKMEEEENENEIIIK